MEKAKERVFALCEELGEPAVLAALERSGQHFSEAQDKWSAWEWVYAQRSKREEANSEAIRYTARQTLYVAVGTGIVAVFTAVAAVVALWH